MNMMSKFADVLSASDEVTPNGAALIGFYGRNLGYGDGRQQSLERRIRRRARARRV